MSETGRSEVVWRPTSEYMERSRIARELMDRVTALVRSRRWLDAMPPGLEVLPPASG